MKQMINKITDAQSLPSSPTCHKPMLSDAVFRPMLFSTKMVQALLDGRKTQTRRVVKDKLLQHFRDDDSLFSTIYPAIHHPIKMENIIWVRETFYQFASDVFHYKAKNGDEYAWKNHDFGIKYKPSLFMPKSACRIWLKVSNVRVERLHDITEQDAINEGVDSCFEKGTEYYKEGDYKNYTWHGEGGNDSFSGYSNAKNAKESYQSLWYKINGKKTWDENPFVWVYDFEVSQDCPNGFR